MEVGDNLWQQLLLSGKAQIYEQTQALNASTKRKHKAQAQNATSNGGDASRVGKGCSYYLAEFVFPSFLYPDAGRVAPISACV